MFLFQEIPAGVEFLLKEDHSGRVCGAHKTQLAKLTKQALVPVEPAKKATWPCENLEEDVVEESQEFMEVMPLAVPRQSTNNNVGRPATFNDQARLQMALLAVNGIALSTVGPAMAIAQAADVEDLKDSRGASRFTVIQAVAELYECQVRHCQDPLEVHQQPADDRCHDQRLAGVPGTPLWGTARRPG